jgi:hypothetical protein
MREHRGVSSVTSHRLTILLLLALLTASLAVSAACGGDDEPANGDDAAAAAEIAAQAEALDALGRRLEAASARADAVQASIVKLAKANRADAEAWREEWAARRDAYEAEVAEVEEYNATVAGPAETGSFTVIDPKTGETTTVEFPTSEAVPAKALPAAPEPPAKLKVRVRRTLTKLTGLIEEVDALETDLASTPLRPELADATAALTVAVAEVRRTLTDMRAALRTGVERDPKLGRLCKKALTRLDLSAAPAVAQAKTALARAAVEHGVPADGLPWAAPAPSPL